MKPNKRHYTQEEANWLKEHLNDASWPDLAKMFNEKFPRRYRTKQAISHFCESKGWFKNCYHQKGCFVYRPEHNEFLRNNREGRTMKELTDMFNEKFGCNQSVDRISSKVIWMGVKLSERPNKKPIGSEFVSQGDVFIKIADVYGADDKNWMLKSRYVYEKAHGKLSKNDRIIFLDGDKNNFDLDNLVKVSKLVLSILAIQRWQFIGQPELQRCAIKWCECAEYIKKHHYPDYCVRNWARRNRIYELY